MKDCMLIQLGLLIAGKIETQMERDELREANNADIEVEETSEKRNKKN